MIRWLQLVLLLLVTPAFGYTPERGHLSPLMIRRYHSCATGCSPSLIPVLTLIAIGQRAIIAERDQVGVGIGPKRLLVR
jgi:hypothetical protein